MNPSNKPGTNRSGGQRPDISARSTPSAVQPKMKTQPVAPPAYKPQQAPRAIQSKWPAALNRHQPSTAQQVLQPKLGTRISVIQLKNCVSCKHKAHAGDCTVQVPAGNGQTKECGCKSHSIKFDKGQKINPGGGKRARMLEAKGGGAKA